VARRILPAALGAGEAQLKPSPSFLVLRSELVSAIANYGPFQQRCTKALELRPVVDAAELAAVYRALGGAAVVGEWLRLPGLGPGAAAFGEYVSRYCWFYAGMVDGRLGGYLLLTNVRGGSADIHFGRSEWVPPRVFLAFVRAVLAWLPEHVREVQAYIPANRPRVRRLAERIGFEQVDDTGDYWHGRLEFPGHSTDTSASASGCAAGES